MPARFTWVIFYFFEEFYVRTKWVIPKQKWLYSVILLFIAAQINFQTRKNGWGKKGKKLSMKMIFLEKVTYFWGEGLTRVSTFYFSCICILLVLKK